MSVFNSGSVQDPSAIITKQQEPNDVRLTLQAAAGQTLSQGQEVYLSGPATVSARTTGAQLPIGTISVGTSPTGRVSTVAVNTIFNKDVFGQSAAAITAGSLVRQVGTINGNGNPDFVAAAAGEYAIGIALTTSAAGGVLRVGYFRSLFKM